MAGTRRARRRCSTTRRALDAKGNVVGWESRGLHPERPQGHRRDAGRGRTRRPAEGEAHRPATSTTPGHPLRRAQHPARRPTGWRHAVPAVLDPHAGPDAEHLRQRELPGRTGGGGRRRPARVPPAQPERRARQGSARAAGEARELGRRAPAAARVRRRRARPRRLLCEVRAGAHLCGRGRRRGGEPQHRRDPGDQLLRRA